MLNSYFDAILLFIAYTILTQARDNYFKKHELCDCNLQSIMLNSNDAKLRLRVLLSLTENFKNNI